MHRLTALCCVLATAAVGCGENSTAGSRASRGHTSPPASVQSTSTTPAIPAQKKIKPHRATRSGVPAIDMPRPSLTPGAAFHTGLGRICTPGYSASVRDVPESEKNAVYTRYGVAHVPYAHEVDHLVSLELGGSNAITNLWPEPYAGRWGARTKDTLENRLHDLVCSHRLGLGLAQRIEANNWVAAYRRYVSSALPNASGAGGPGAGSTGAPTGVASGGYYASSYPTARTIYCADDSAWKGLSKRYLVHFATWATAHARFPSYHLHHPC